MKTIVFSNKNDQLPAYEYENDIQYPRPHCTLIESWYDAGYSLNEILHKIRQHSPTYKLVYRVHEFDIFDGKRINRSEADALEDRHAIDKFWRIEDLPRQWRDLPFNTFNLVHDDPHGESVWIVLLTNRVLDFDKRMISVYVISDIGRFNVKARACATADFIQRASTSKYRDPSTGQWLNCTLSKEILQNRINLQCRIDHETAFPPYPARR